MRIFLIVALILIAIILLIVWWVWNVVFRRSLRKALFTFIGIAIDRDARVDPDAPIMPSEEQPLSEVLEAQAQQVNFDDALASHQHHSLPKATLLPEDDEARDTSDNGWPRQLDYKTRHERQPFREVHLRTENEEIHEIMDVDTYVEPDSPSE